jgi:integrase
MPKATNDSEIRKQINSLETTISVGDGLHLKRLASNAYAWRYNYTYAGKQKTVAYGTFPQVSLSEARSRHKETLRQRYDLKDPMAERAAIRKAAQAPLAETFQTVAQEWLRKQEKTWTYNHYRDVARSLDGHVFPVIGKMPITSIDPADVLAALKGLEAAGKHETSHRCHQRIAAVFAYAIATQRCRTNPADGIRGALTPVVKTHMPAVEPSELPELLRKINGYDGEAVTRLGLKFMALTFVRTTEMIQAQWDEIDWEQAEWNIPAGRMKRRRDHIVPLSTQAIAILEELKALNGESRYVFKLPRNTGPISNNTLLYALYRLGYHSRMTGHGFRSVASTILNELQWNPDVIESQFAHVPDNEVRSAYNRAKYIVERHRMMQWWGDHLDAILNGAKVIPLRRIA